MELLEPEAALRKQVLFGRWRFEEREISSNPG
jgi:hypothetical protein